MGSKKYPQEDDYINYMANNAGVQNAFTYDNTTTYYFHVSSNAFEGALDRFSQGFTQPLLSESCVKREVNAVDSEFKGLLQSDYMKLRQIKKSSSCSEHPYSYFYVGNLQTLQADGLAEQVRNLFNKHYSADIMKMNVASSHDMDQIIEWVVSMFSGIQRRDFASQQSAKHPLSKDTLGKLVYYQTNEQYYKMDIEFPLPDIQPFYKTAPATYYSSLLDYKGPGSLYEMLVQAGLIVNIQSYVEYPYYNGFNMFTVQFTLTSSGYQRFMTVLSALFAYFQMLDEKGPQEKYFNELMAKQSLERNYENKRIPVTSCIEVSMAMCNRYLLPQNALISCATHYDAKLISQFIQYFTPLNCQVFIGGPDHPKLSLDKYEPYFRTQYCIRRPRISEDIAKLCSSKRTSSFELPIHNQYMPQQLNIVGTSDPDKITPTLLQKTELIETWHKLDNQYFTPNGNINLLILLPNAQPSIIDYVAADVLEKYVNKELVTVFDDASAAGMEFAFTSKPEMLLLTISGISENQPLLLKNLLEKIRALKISEHAFDCALSDTKLMYQDMRLKQPFEQLQDLETIQLAQTPVFDLAELENATVTTADIQAKINSIFSQTYSKLLVNGNFSEACAIDIATMIIQTMSSKPLLKTSHIPTRQVDIKPGHYIYQTMARGLETTNNAVRVNIYCGSDLNNKDAVIIDQLVSLISNSFFYQLRTQEQLGYIVQAYSETHDNGSISMVFCIQGEANPLYLTLRINQFIKEFRQRIAACSMEKFKQLVEASKKLRSTIPNDVIFETRMFWIQIQNGTYSFSTREQKVELLDSLQQHELLDMWDACINDETATNYTRVDMQMWSAKTSCPTETELKSYSEQLLCLFKCLESAGYNVDVDELQGFVEMASYEKDKAIEALMLKYASSRATTDIYREISAETVRNLLDAAINSIAAHTKPASTQQVDSAPKSMVEISGGRWLITDIVQFKEEQNVYPLPTPAIKFHPKYTATWELL
ncbi:metalloprotease [Coemansia brasiliensis]|uniref:Metalloprotease n=1 Tax=Coemansia brasiliensis TaxID=2650707 RepID=A0A9W8I6N1_9FUNG|nr:metalloprotease [Coemansia brasiliensis]